MQVKIRLDRQWWLLPTPQGITEEEFAPFSKVRCIGVFGMNESVHFFDMQTKEHVLRVLSLIKQAAQQRMKPTYSKGGNIAFVPTRKVKVSLPA